MVQNVDCGTGNHFLAQTSAGTKGDKTYLDAKRHNYTSNY